MMQNIQSFALAGVFAVATAVSASAVPIIDVVNAPGSWAAVDPSTSTDIVGGSWTFSPAIVSGSVSGQYKSPFDPADSGAPAGSEIASWQDIDYFTVGSPNKAIGAILDFDAPQTVLSLLWGSIDTYNVLYFYDALGGGLATISGQDILDAGGDPASNGAAFVTISGIGAFSTIGFFSDYPSGTTRAAFEFSNVVAAVPLPAGGLLLLTALGGLAAVRRRKA